MEKQDLFYKPFSDPRNQTARKWMNSSPSVDEIHIKCMTLSFKFVYNSMRDYIKVINETSLFISYNLKG